MTDSLTITARHNGPPGSANGGYTCGLLAQLVDAEAIEVTLRKPPPLERPLSLAGDAEHVELRDGERLVAEARPAELLLDVPEAVPAEELERAEAGGHEHWTAKHPFPTCFVCGPERAPGDGLRIFPLELPGHERDVRRALAPRRVAGSAATARFGPSTCGLRSTARRARRWRTSARGRRWCSAA